MTPARLPEWGPASVPVRIRLPAAAAWSKMAATSSPCCLSESPASIEECWIPTTPPSSGLKVEAIEFRGLHRPSVTSEIDLRHQPAAVPHTLGAGVGDERGGMGDRMLHRRVRFVGLPAVAVLGPLQEPGLNDPGVDLAFGGQGAGEQVPADPDSGLAFTDDVVAGGDGVPDQGCPAVGLDGDAFGHAGSDPFGHIGLLRNGWRCRWRRVRGDDPDAVDVLGPAEIGVSPMVLDPRDGDLGDVVGGVAVGGPDGSSDIDDGMPVGASPVVDRGSFWGVPVAGVFVPGTVPRLDGGAVQGADPPALIADELLAHSGVVGADLTAVGDRGGWATRGHGGVLRGCPGAGGRWRARAVRELSARGR